ncbi:hypothetical protein BgAZ_106840 [Babesia gibsoni]|uniref:Peroxisome assembly protein 22 n=1 Tax=Babesia gibsoni TaxID=33632 RepID=A0AAD8UVW2_BABGI|nr:hypothetical protein BgAZ_106840 [Babesia gibsoni]
MLEDNRDSMVVSIGIVLLSLVFFLYWHLRELRRLRHHHYGHYDEESESTKRKTSISIFANDLIFCKGTLDLQVDNARVLADLASKCSLYLFIQVENEDDVEVILQELEQCDAFKGELKKHRVLFSHTSSGRASMVRQLQPMVHVESNVTVANAIDGRIANLAKFKVTEKTAHDDPDKAVTEDGTVFVFSAEDVVDIIQPFIVLT